MDWKSLIFGRPMKTRDSESAKLGLWQGLSILAPDALSSVAYGTEAILVVLATAGIGALWYSLPISGVIALLLVFLVLSYRQIVAAYPNGGGAYVIGRDTLGNFPSLLAGAALLVDYTLTVSVSVTAGVAALISAFPSLTPLNVAICVLIVLVLTVINLRGVRESAQLFAGPVYLFILMILIMVAVGLFVPAHHAPALRDYVSPTLPSAVTLLLVLRAFSSGSSALTGVEAISNGVPLFKEPAPRRARMALLLLGIFLGTMFVGTSVIAYRFHIIPNGHVTVLQQLAYHVFGKGIYFYLLSFVTMSILSIAANTSFAGFPQLASLMARDQWMPRMFVARGDRLVYQNGIIVLGSISALLIVIFRGNTESLIPLYAIGVYMSFTIAMVSLVKKRLSEKDLTKGRVSTVIIGVVGAFLTATVVVVAIVTKFTEGAWIVVLAIPALMFAFHRVRAHYISVANQLRLTELDVKPIPSTLTVIVPVASINRMTIATMSYALSMSDQVIAVSVAFNAEQEAKIHARWKQWNPSPHIRLVVLLSQYRSVLRPLLHFVDHFSELTVSKPHLVVLIPELVVPKSWQNILHNHLGIGLQARLIFRKNVVVAMVPYRLEPDTPVKK
ncbi:MAG: APC family permease [Sulfobacillus sp.]